MDDGYWTAVLEVLLVAFIDECPKDFNVSGSGMPNSNDLAQFGTAICVEQNKKKSKSRQAFRAVKEIMIEEGYEGRTVMNEGGVALSPS